MVQLNKQALDGNVETFILSILDEGPSYGYAIVQDLKARSEGLLELGEGTVYPVLYRMEKKGLLTATSRKAENGRMRKYYRVSPKGRAALKSNLAQWEYLVEVMSKMKGSNSGNIVAEGGAL